MLPFLGINSVSLLSKRKLASPFLLNPPKSESSWGERRSEEGEGERRERAQRVLKTPAEGSLPARPSETHTAGTGQELPLTRHAAFPSQVV